MTNREKKEPPIHISATIEKPEIPSHLKSLQQKFSAALDSKDDKEVKKLLESVDKTEVSILIGNRLHDAVEACDLDTLAILLRHGINPDTLDEFEYTPLEIALNEITEENVSSYIEVIKLLLKHHADPNRKNGAPFPLHAAVRARSVELVQLFLEFKADPNIPNETGLTALDTVLHSDNIRWDNEDIQMARSLLQAKANPNSENLPLHSLALEALDADERPYYEKKEWEKREAIRKELMMLLLKWGADPKRSNEDEESVDAVATHKKDTKAQEALIIQGEWHRLFKYLGPKLPKALIEYLFSFLRPQWYNVGISTSHKDLKKSSAFSGGLPTFFLDLKPARSAVAEPVPTVAGMIRSILIQLIESNKNRFVISDAAIEEMTMLSTRVQLDSWLTRYWSQNNGAALNELLLEKMESLPLQESVFYNQIYLFLEQLNLPVLSGNPPVDNKLVQQSITDAKTPPALPALSHGRMFQVESVFDNLKLKLLALFKLSQSSYKVLNEIESLKSYSEMQEFYNLEKQTLTRKLQDLMQKMQIIVDQKAPSLKNVKERLKEGLEWMDKLDEILPNLIKREKEPKERKAAGLKNN